MRHSKSFLGGYRCQVNEISIGWVQSNFESTRSPRGTRDDESAIDITRIILVTVIEIITNQEISFRGQIKSNNKSRLNVKFDI